MVQLLRQIQTPLALYACCTRRQFSRSLPATSGHSKWKTIQHDKSRNDASRGKQRQILAAELALASRDSADPSFNPRLADAIAKAKKSGFPKAGIEAAILRGQGKSSTGATLEPVTIEAVVPPVAFIVETLTDSKARTLMEVKMILKRTGGQVGPSSYLFTKRGRIAFSKRAGIGIDEIMEVALDAGAVDIFEDNEGQVVVDTVPEELKTVEKLLSDAYELQVLSSGTIWLPNDETKVQALEEEAASQLSQLEEDLQDLDEVHSIYTNLDLTTQRLNTNAT